jgi:hypothetical protein
MWVDGDFLKQIVGEINDSAAGRKSRFTHPALSADGLAKFLGRGKQGSVDGDIAHADLHLAKSAHRTPDGDLAGYVMDRAEEDAGTFGASIAFERDHDAEEQHRADNGGENFSSPDPLNTKNLPHVRLKRLRAVDIVDDPAANPSGLFTRGQEVAIEAERLAEYALGLSSERPAVEQFDVDPDRLSSFVARFLSARGLSINHLSEDRPTMSDTKTPESEKPAEKPAETKPVEAPAPAVDKPAEAPAAETKPADKPAETQHSGKDFLTAFGDKGGVWFAEGKTFAEAQTLYLASMRTELAARDERIAALEKRVGFNRGEETGLSHGAGGDKPSDAEQKKMIQRVGSAGLARFAAGIKFANK